VEERQESHPLVHRRAALEVACLMRLQ
jgi:hypothetical protein